MFYATPGASNDVLAAPITVSINEWMADNTHTLATRRTTITTIGSSFTTRARTLWPWMAIT